MSCKIQKIKVASKSQYCMQNSIRWQEISSEAQSEKQQENNQRCRTFITKYLLLLISQSLSNLQLCILNNNLKAQSILDLLAIKMTQQQKHRENMKYKLEIQLHESYQQLQKRLASSQEQAQQFCSLIYFRLLRELKKLEDDLGEQLKHEVQAYYKSMLARCSSSPMGFFTFIQCAIQTAINNAINGKSLFQKCLKTSQRKQQQKPAQLAYSKQKEASLQKFKAGMMLELGLTKFASKDITPKVVEKYHNILQDFQQLYGIMEVNKIKLLPILGQHYEIGLGCSNAFDCQFRRNQKILKKIVTFSIQKRKAKVSEQNSQKRSLSQELPAGRKSVLQFQIRKSCIARRQSTMKRSLSNSTEASRTGLALLGRSLQISGIEIGNNLRKSNLKKGERLKLRL